MEPAEHLGALEAASGALLDAAAGALERPVAACPGWNVADLVVHMGLVWAWAADVVTSGERAEREGEPEERNEAPLLDWARQRAARIVDALSSADPDTPCWTFGDPGTRRFWFRRQALETVLHAWDAAEAAGRLLPVDPEVAADGVDECLGVLVPRWLGRHPGAWDGESLHLHRTDGPGEWVVRMGPAGEVGLQRAHAKGDVAVRGAAPGLWLWSANRWGLEEAGLEVLGDRSVAERWSAETAF